MLRPGGTTQHYARNVRAQLEYNKYDASTDLQLNLNKRADTNIKPPINEVHEICYISEVVITAAWR